ncbi:MAG TPA: glutamine synthetase family protein [Pseudonocardia sp.]|nr:glutamine synthetase family protein [Pseudonocardia sp.]
MVSTEAGRGPGADGRPRAGQAAEVTEWLRAEGVRAVATTFVDNTGITRVKAIPVSRLEHVAGMGGVGMSPCFDTYLLDDSMTASRELGGPDGDLRLVPDLDALTVLGAQPGWAWAPADRYTQDGAPYPACQRSFARRAVERARAAGLSFRMAFEIEWVLGRATEDGTFSPAVAGPAYGMTRLVGLSDYALDLMDALAAQDVPVEQFHPEYAAGQCEISVAATDPLHAADRSVLVRQTIRAVSARHGTRASFAPSVVPGTVGNGGHVHFSACRDGRNVFAGGTGPYGMTDEGARLIAGVLDALPALTAVGCPSPASYLRLVPSRWAGPFQAWGRETRETAVRFVTGSAGVQDRAANVEVKCVDLAANPYLLAGSLLTAALAGAEGSAPLPAEVTGDPATRAGDRTPRLPRTLAEAVEHLERSAVLREAMGEVLFGAFAAVRRAEAGKFADRPPDEIAAATRWVY